MQSFGQFLCEDMRYDGFVEFGKYLRFYPNGPKAKSIEKMIANFQSRIPPKNVALGKKEVADFVPGACPDCDGIGFDKEFDDCTTCDATGLPGMNEAQGKWWAAAHRKLLDAKKAGDHANENDHDDWEAVCKVIGIKPTESLVNSNLFKGIMKAANNQGIRLTPKSFEFDDPEDAEYYEGGEWRHEISIVGKALYQIRDKFAKKAR